MPSTHPDTLDLLRLTLTPGLGPVLISRALDTLGSPGAVLGASEHALRRVKGIGDDRARAIVQGADAARRAADDELALAETLGIRILARCETGYPALLSQINDAPPILYIRGHLDPGDSDRFPIGIVGSRSCTQYGTEQSERFAAALAQAGLTIVSGGARGIDTAAHRAALRVKGRTVAVLGCGLADCYPPDNRELFDRIAAGSGAVISELPLRTPPNAENFPARNRIISGLSLGTLVVEAAKRSGALITARLAAEDHAREVFALPARVDSASAAGSLELIKSGGAQMVTHPDDILAALETPARHLHAGTHEARYAPAAALFDGADDQAQPTDAPPLPPKAQSPRDAALSPSQAAVLNALDKPRGMDELASVLNIPAHALRADITILEVKRRVRRRGTLLERVDA
jgi:DNA processing protein